MGAGAGAAASVENEPSPRRAAIEKAQAELRREVAVREERRRELEFLEKGGELLDFFSAANSTLLPASLADPLADRLVASEAECGYSSIGLANGDSLETSVGSGGCAGRGSEGGNHRVADDGAGAAASESLSSSWESKVRALRAGSPALRCQGDVNLRRDSEFVGSVRQGVKGQAYSRRNRQRSNRFGNGYAQTREVEKSLESAATPSTDLKSPPAPPPLSIDVSKIIETMVEKNAKPSLVDLPFIDTSGDGVDLESANAGCGDSIIPILNLIEQPLTKNEPTDHANVDVRKAALSSGVPAVADLSSLSGDSNENDVVCTNSDVSHDLLVGSDLETSNHLPVAPILEENVVLGKEDNVVSESSKQVSCSSPAALDKEGVFPLLVKDENSLFMVRDNMPVSGQAARHAPKGECKDKPYITAVDNLAHAQRVTERNCAVPVNHVRDPSALPSADDMRNVPLDTPRTSQGPSMNLDSVEKRCNNLKRSASTVSGGEVAKTESVMTNKKPPDSGQVEVKIEEVFSEGVTRMSSLDSEAESGHDVKSVRVISLPQEEIKTEGQCTPMSGGSNRASFRTPGSLTASNRFLGVVYPWEKEKDPSVIAAAERHKADLSAKAKKAHEDCILEDAEIIKKGRKDTAEWGNREPGSEPTKRKSHWDFVLEEMAWMANDFMQERLWKMAAATQFCHWIAHMKGHSEFRGSYVKRRQKKVAHILANSVGEFWRSLESTLYKDKAQTLPTVNSQQRGIATNVKEEGATVPMDVDVPAVPETSTNYFAKKQMSRSSLPIQEYAKRFLRDSFGVDVATQAEAPSTPERTSEVNSIFDPLWEEQFPEGPLSYTVPNTAFAAYRYSVETQRSLIEADYEQTLQDQAAALAEAEAQAAAEAVATSDFIFASMDDSQSLGALSSPTKVLRADDDGAQYGLPHCSIAKKKRKNFVKSIPKGEGLLSSGLQRPPGFLQGLDSAGGLPSPLVTGRRSLPAAITPTGANIGSIPTKRMRSGTARQRPLGTASPSAFPGSAALLHRTTFSSGALNSNHGEAHSLPDSPIPARVGGDAASAGKISLGGGSSNSFMGPKSKKKKKPKHFSATLSSGLKADGATSGNTGSTLRPVESEHHSVFDQLKRKGDQLHAGALEVPVGLGSSVGTPETPASQGGQPSKKLKLSKQASDINLDVAATAVTIPMTQAVSVVNTSSTSKLLRENSNRDRNRKSRTKVSVSQPAGIGIPWSTIEDQAILALVHDLGPNWELVSDVLSSSSQLKGIFRKPKQCKERYKALMDRLSVGEGGDSPEDPSTSQPHPSASPGISKGSARVLLQRLQGPMEEDTLKVHLEHIVRVVHKFRALKPQNDEQKSLLSPHISHLNTMSQFCNSGLAGGFPTPLELCDLSTGNAELGGPSYQMAGPHLSGVLPAGPGMRPTTNGMQAMAGANNLHLRVPALSPSSTAANAAARDVHRLSMRPFSPDEVRYARQMAARGYQAASVPASLPMMALPNPNDCTMPTLAAGNSVGTMDGLSRGMSLSRAGLSSMGSPGVPGMGSPTLGNMLPPGGVGMVGAGSNVGSAGVSNLMRRAARDQMARPGRINEEQRQLFLELQHQAAQGNTEPQTALSNFNRDMSNPMIPPTPQNFSAQQQQQYLVASRMAKEQQLQQHKQRLLQQHLQQPTSLPSPLQQQQLHAMSKQHALPQQAHLSQHQHLLPPQPLALQKQHNQQAPQQPCLPLPSSSMQSMASTHQQQHQNSTQSQSHVQQQSQAPGQVSQPSVPTKLQHPKQLQKHQHLQQSSQALQQQQQQQQQQQPRGPKGVRGNMGMQPGQSGMLPANVALGNQVGQQMPGQAPPHSMPGQWSLQPQGTKLSQNNGQGTSGKGGQTQAVQNQVAAGSSALQGSAGQQQKGLQQQSQMSAPQASPQLHPPQSPSTSGLSAQQRQLSPPPVQESQPQQQPRRQPQQQNQSSQSGQRRLQQRPPGSSISANQVAKNGPTQQGHIPQILNQPGHVPYPLGTTNGGGCGNMPGTTGTGGMNPLGNSSGPAGLQSTQWKPGQNVSPMPTGIYNLTRSGNSGAQVPSVVNSAGMHMASPNGSGGIPQLHQPMQSVSGGHGQKMGMVAGANPKPIASQGGAQRSGQQLHGVPPTGHAKTSAPAASGGLVPVSSVGPNAAAAAADASQSGSMALQGGSSQSSMPVFGAQPRQSVLVNAAATAAVPQKPASAAATTTAANSASVAVSASSPASVANNSTIADQAISS